MLFSKPSFREALKGPCRTRRATPSWSCNCSGKLTGKIVSSTKGTSNACRRTIKLTRLVFFTPHTSFRGPASLRLLVVGVYSIYSYHMLRWKTSNYRRSSGRSQWSLL